MSNEETRRCVEAVRSTDDSWACAYAAGEIVFARAHDERGTMCWVEVHARGCRCHGCAPYDFARPVENRFVIFEVR